MTTDWLPDSSVRLLTRYSSLPCLCPARNRCSAFVTTMQGPSNESPIQQASLGLRRGGKWPSEIQPQLLSCVPPRSSSGCSHLFCDLIGIWHSSLLAGPSETQSSALKALHVASHPQGASHPPRHAAKSPCCGSDGWTEWFRAVPAPGRTFSRWSGSSGNSRQGREVTGMSGGSDPGGWQYEGS